MNRIATAVNNVRTKLSELEADKVSALDTEMAVAFDEHFAFQNAQARAHATGKITADEARIVYVALGEVGSSANGGWAAETDTATKIAVTLAMGELLRR